MTTAASASAPLRVLRAVDEAEQVALVERPESVHLVDHPRVPPEATRQPLGELEAQVEAMSADVKEQVAGRRGRAVPGAGEPRERMQPGRARRAEQPLPHGGADAHHAGQRPLRDPEAHRSPEPADVRQHVADPVLGPRIDGQREEDRRLGDRGQDGLRARRPLRRRRFPRHRAVCAVPGRRSRPAGSDPNARSRPASAPSLPRSMYREVTTPPRTLVDRCRPRGRCRVLRRVPGIYRPRSAAGCRPIPGPWSATLPAVRRAVVEVEAGGAR